MIAKCNTNISVIVRSYKNEIDSGNGSFPPLSNQIFNNKNVVRTQENSYFLLEMVMPLATLSGICLAVSSFAYATGQIFYLI